MGTNIHDDRFTHKEELTCAYLGKPLYNVLLLKMRAHGIYLNAVHY